VNVVASILAMVGIGTGIFVPANSTALFASAPDHQRGAAAGTLATARNMGMALGVAFAGAAAVEGTQVGFVAVTMVALLSLLVCTLPASRRA
jgi:MFS family permease